MSVSKSRSTRDEELVERQAMSMEKTERETLCGFMGGDEEQKRSFESREYQNRVWVSTHLEKLIGRTLELGSRHPSWQGGRLGMGLFREES